MPTGVVALPKKAHSNQNLTYVRTLKLRKLVIAIRMRMLTGTINTIYLQGPGNEVSDGEKQETQPAPSLVKMVNYSYSNATFKEAQHTQKNNFSPHRGDINILWLMDLLQHHQKEGEAMRFRKLVASLDYYQDREATLSRKMALTQIGDMISILETLIEGRS